jgi:hypothetical protein
MRIDVNWLSAEKQVVHIVYHAKWDWADFQEHRRQAKLLTQDIHQPVPVLIEYDRDASLLPPNALRNLSLAAETADPKVGLIVLVAPSQLWRVVFTLLKRLLPNSPTNKTHIVRTREEALALLQNYAESSSS